MTKRFLEKYVGTYRVLAYYDEATEDFPRDDNGEIDESFDDLYIPCARGEIKEAIIDGQQMLAWYVDSAEKGRNVLNKLKATYPKVEVIEDNCGSYDYYLYFTDKELKQVADIVQPRTNGAKIKPFSDKNLPKPAYIIPEADNEKFNKIVENLNAIDKMQFVKKCCNAFDEVIQTKKGAKYNVAAERKNSKLKSKNFIHSLGMWDDFVKFTKSYLKEWESEGIE